MRDDSSHSLFYDENGSPRLSNSYCVFADLLGFKDEIMNSCQSGREEDVFQSFMQKAEPEIRRIFHPEDEGSVPGNDREWVVKIFSDNILLVYPLWTEYAEHEFGAEIGHIMYFQMAMALQGYFVRGGWSVGKLFVNKNTVWGKPLIEAYGLEKDCAVYPRIILSPDMKELVFRQSSFYAIDQDSPHCRQLIIDEKGTISTNYLSQAILSGYVDPDVLMKHREQIMRNLKNYQKNDKIRLKYEWLAAHHNHFCGNLTEEEGYSSSYFVERDFNDFGIRALTNRDSPYRRT